MHLEQIFLDSKDAYVWIYDPTPWYYWVGGTAIVLVTIGKSETRVQCPQKIVVIL